MDNKRRSEKKGELNTEKTNALPPRDKKTHIAENTRGSAGRYGTRPVRHDRKNESEKIIKLFDHVTESDIHKRIERKRKNERRKKENIMRFITIAAVAAVAVALVFMTPLFSIREIRLNGNDTVSKEVINSKIGDLIGANLFGTSASEVKKRMTEIPQISDVEVKKTLFPSGLELTISERKPAGSVKCGKETLIIDSDLRIIDDGSVFDSEKYPGISGVSVSEYELNESLKIKSGEKRKILKEILTAFENVGITESVKYVSMDDITSITFNYDNRLDVICGSQLQIDRKIRMFAECLNTSTFDENSIGTVDLSVPGTASYNP